VTIKVLPADVASDPQRLRRFEQEAPATASRNWRTLPDVALFLLFVQQRPANGGKGPHKAKPKTRQI
jgi:hypothetical protein